MGDKKKLALLLGQAEEPYQREFIKGVTKQAARYGLVTCIFSMFIKYQNSKEREIGDSNIYNLINFDEFAGVIILSDTIQTPGVEKEIEERVKNWFDGPVVCVDTDSPYFYSFWTDGSTAVYDLISHLIEVHGYKDIAYLTGRRNHIHSIKRLEAYKQSMADHGLTIRDDRVFYGDFWYTSGKGCAEMLARDRDKLPQAIACANDCMAIGFAEEIQKHGFRIPEDIAIVGYGSTDEGILSPKQLTSTMIPSRYYGEFAVDAISKLRKGEEIPEPAPDTELYLGESCGCDASIPLPTQKRDTWMSNDSEEGYYSIHNTMMEDLLACDTIEEFFRTVYEHIYYLRGVQHLEICLNEQWISDDYLIENEFPEKGYSKSMINVLSFDSENQTLCRIGTDRHFETSKLLPEVHGSTLFAPLFFEEKSFGYVAISLDFTKGGCDEAFRLWVNALSRGLEAYRRLVVSSALMSQVDKLESLKYKPSSSGLRQDKLSDEEIQEMNEVGKILDENLLVYHFQPIVNAVDGEIYSYEALMRSNSERKIPPLQIIKCADMLGRLADVEKATFLNVLNFVNDNPDQFEDKKVFINSIPGLSLDYNDFVKIEEILKKSSGKAVVELTEQAELGDRELDELKTQYRRLGIGLAVDDYGTGYSNVGNLLRYMPDIVKIDRSLLSEIQTNAQKQHFVREIIEFCHANKIMALAEGVETKEELGTVIRLGADLIQGYYVARPSAEVLQSVDANVKMEIARYHREREDGSSESTYVAGRTNRVSVNSLMKENKTTIIVGAKDATFRDLTIIGTPNTDTDLHIEVLEGYDGRVTLENVTLKSKKLRPCIHMAENSEMTLVLEGENVFKGGGILVPEGSNLSIEGDGNLKILVSGADIFAIGNAADKGHGRIEFFQDGEIYIDAKGQNTIGIGSGLGGITKITKGKYILIVNGDEGVGIGSFKGEQPIEIHDCDMMIDSTFFKGVCIGNVEGNTDMDISRSLVRCKGGGKRVSLLGSIDGEKAKLNLHDLNMKFKIAADYSTGMGSLSGSSDIKIDTAGLDYNGMGREALVFGGFNENVNIDIYNVATEIDLSSDNGKITNALKENISEKYRNSTIIINGQKIVDDSNLNEES